MAYALRQSDDSVMIAEGAVVVADVTLGKGVNIWYNAVLRGDEAPIIIGENTNIQEGCLLHGTRPTLIGKGCTVGHHAIVHACTLGDNVLVGMGSIILDGAVIEDDCLIGAGALVTGKTHAPAGSLLLGSPAKVVRALTPEEIERSRSSCRSYLHLAECYRKGKAE